MIMAKKSDVLGLHRLKNQNVKRNVFDISSQKFATQCVGEILPVFVEEVMPNDRLSINAHSFTRTAPLSSTAFASFSHEVKYFFVPYSQLWRYFRPQIINTSMKNLNGSFDSYIANGFVYDETGNTHFPYFNRNTLSACIVTAAKSGRLINRMYQRAVGMAKLSEALGYGTYSSILNPANWSEVNGVMTWNGDLGSDDYTTYDGNVLLNPFRYLAYQKICFDYFRIKQWQQNRAYMFNMDYISPSKYAEFQTYFSAFVNNGQMVSTNVPIFCDMNICSLPLSAITGSLPKPQFGSVASAKVSTDYLSLNSPSFSTDVSPVASQSVDAFVSNSQQKLGIDSHIIQKVYSSDVASTSSVDVNELRYAFALQKYREIVGSNDNDYISQIEAHFGFRPKVESTRCTFIGGFSDEINVSTVVNNNLSDNNSTVLGGLMQSSANGNIDFTAPDYGIVIGVSTYVPQFSYPAVGIDRRNTYSDVTDFPVPELDSVGMQEQRLLEIDANFNVLNGYGKTSSIGYVPRYFEWKMSKNLHLGYFNFALNNQVLGFSTDKMVDYDTDDPSSSAYVSNWLNCLPEYADNVFTNNRHQLLSDDTFYTAYGFNVSVVRSMSVYGLPDCN